MKSHPFAYKRLSRQPGVKTRVNVKSRLIKLVLLPLWYGNKDIIRDNLSGRHIVENFDIVSIQHYPKEEEIHIHLDEKKSIPVEFSSRRVVFNEFTSAVSRNGRCGTPRRSMCFSRRTLVLI